MKAIMKLKVSSLDDDVLLKAATTLADSLEKELPGVQLGNAVLRELIERYTELRWRMDGLEK
jgi:hypothetical protein